MFASLKYQKEIYKKYFFLNKKRKPSQSILCEAFWINIYSSFEILAQFASLRLLMKHLNAIIQKYIFSVCSWFREPFWKSHVSLFSGPFLLIFSPKTTSPAKL